MDNKSESRVSSRRNHSEFGSDSPSARSRRGSATNSAPTIDAAWFLNVLRRWWKVAVPLGLVCGALAASAVFYIEVPVYEARAIMRVEQEPTGILEDPKPSRYFMDHQKELILSELVIGPVLNDPEIAQLPEIVALESKGDVVAGLSGKIKVSARFGSSLIYISYAGPNPKNAATIVNKIADEYFRTSKGNSRTRDQETIRLLSDEAKSAELEVETLRERVRKLTMESGAPDPFGMNPTVTIQSNAPRSADDVLAGNEVDQAVLRARIGAFEASLKTADPVTAPEIPDEVVRDAVENDANVIRLQQELSQIQSYLDEIDRKSVQGSSAPYFQRFVARQEQIKSSLEEVREAVSSQLRRQRKKDFQQKQEIERAKAMARLSEMKSELQSLEISHSVLSERHKQEQSEVKPGVGETVQLLFARDELNRAQNVLDRVKDRMLIIQTNMRSPGIISDDWLRAKPPALPVEIMPLKKMTMAGGGGLFIPFLLLGLWELRQSRVSDIDQLLKQADLMVVGEVANLPSQATSRKTSNSLRRGVKLFEESVDSLRTGLVLAGANRDMRVLAITSAVSGEGKTSIAAQLAVSLARSTGQPTLLIDGDMRSPDLHNVFDVDLGPGLAQFLLGTSSLDDVLYETGCAGLDLIPAGRLATSPHRLLGGTELASLLNTARQKYRYVVIDTPPILGASEALVMSKAADASLLCVMRDVSRIDQVRCAWDRLTTAEANPAGAVLSNVPTRSYMYSYGQYPYEVV